MLFISGMCTLLFQIWLVILKCFSLLIFLILSFISLSILNTVSNKSDLSHYYVSKNSLHCFCWILLVLLCFLMSILFSNGKEHFLEHKVYKLVEAYVEMGCSREVPLLFLLGNWGHYYLSHFKLIKSFKIIWC